MYRIYNNRAIVYVTCFIIVTLCILPKHTESMRWMTKPQDIQKQYQPGLIRIALAGRGKLDQPDGMTVSWSTEQATSTSVVYHGEMSGQLNQEERGNMTSYLDSFHHHVTLNGLKPSTTYYYKCGDPQISLSEEFNFTTAPDVQGQGDPSVTIAIYGDMGYGNSSANTMKTLFAMKDRYDFVWHVGDIAYQDDYMFIDFMYEEILDRFMDQMQTVTAYKPYMVSPGNHDVDCHSLICLAVPRFRNSLSNFTAYNTRFKMPSEESGGIMNMWYSYNYGKAHIISLDSETDFKDAYEGKRDEFFLLRSGGFEPYPGAYLAWLEEDLKKANDNRGVRPWIIVGAHRPLYLYEDSGVFQDAVESLLLKYGVDLYFSGHIHSYYRTFPIFNGTYANDYTDAHLPVHIVAGGAGAIDKPMSGAKLDKAAGSDEGFVAYHTSEHSFGLLDINETALHWELISSDTGSVLDRLTLTK